MPDPLARSALFLDRDGVLNEDRGYVYRWEDFRWIPGARETVAAFNRAGWLVIVVTNQSGVGRGYYSEDDMHALHARMQADLAEAGGRIDAFITRRSTRRRRLRPIATRTRRCASRTRE